MPTEIPPTYFQIGEDEFRHRALNARDEFHCARRVAPLVKSTGVLVTAMAARGETEDSDWLASLIEGSAPLLKALSLLSDADADFVIARCMGATEAREGETWVPTWDSARQSVALARLNTNHVLRITYQVMREAISVFFSQARLSLIELEILRPTTAR